MTATYIGGIHPNTASIRNVLAAQGLNLSEAMLLGIGGGLGAGYVLWEFKAHESAIIVLGFRNRWNYQTERLTILCERLDAKHTVQEAGGAKAAAANLQAALDAGRPFIAWVDKAHLPHQFLPEALKGYASHIVGVHEQKGDDILVDDLGEKLFAVPVDIFAAGRARIGSDKNRLLLVEAPGKVDLKKAIVMGIQDHIQHLGGDSDSFNLPVYKKWARMLTDTRNKKGWPVVFKKRVGLYATLRSVYEGIVLDGTDGAGLRSMYADFLDEAAPIVNKPALKEVARHYRNVAELWKAFAESALPDKPFKETRNLLNKRYRLLKRHELNELRKVSIQLDQMMNEMNHAFPLDNPAITTLFTAMQARLDAVYQAEVAALEALKQVTL
jgi:hypothetical protein